MPKNRRLRALRLLKKEARLQKWLYIFFHGSLLWGGIFSLLSSVFIELSYTSFQLNEDFYKELPSRLLVSHFFMMFAGLGLGHWLWTLHIQQKELDKMKATSPILRHKG